MLAPCGRNFVTPASPTGAASRADDPPLVEVQDLVKRFPVRGGMLFGARVAEVHAVDGVSFSIRRRETLGLVGESGCGKSTLSRLLLRLIEPTAGRVLFEGRDVMEFDGVALRSFRCEAQIVFQDPFGSLNPRMTIGDIIAESMLVNRTAARRERVERVARLLEQVGLHPDHARRYPHEFSGGQRQRIGIARALAIGPKLVVCDEPVSALDVSVQAQIVNLLQDLQADLALTYLFVSHDLGVVRHVCDRVAVMYLGKIVEIGDNETIFTRPGHPYTEALLAAIPEPSTRGRRGPALVEGDVPSPIDPPSGCRFHTRCRFAEAVCREVEPALLDVGDGHHVACHLHTPLSGMQRKE
ncbi:MAG: dipeptide ABC transporter ATP-binding protein [Alphaproteobacteria bacterium]|nr:dipeptide ABC transporter ATP-binding protein [Alphaproteobacteria bacterium]